MFCALHDQLASLGRHAQLTRCFSAVAELLVLGYAPPDIVLEPSCLCRWKATTKSVRRMGSTVRGLRVLGHNNNIITSNTLKIHYCEQINFWWLEAKASRPRPRPRPRFFCSRGLSSRSRTDLEDPIPICSNSRTQWLLYSTYWLTLGSRDGWPLSCTYGRQEATRRT